MSNLYNFAAGPAMLPEPVLLRAQRELLNWQNTGVSVMEIGHRTPIFQTLLTELEQKLRVLMDIPQHYKILFLPGGAQGQFSFIPMNLCKYNNHVDYIVSGVWSERAAKFAQKYAEVTIVTTATSDSVPKPDRWSLNPNAAYLYYCPNETINGIQLYDIPSSHDVPVVADMTSCILSSSIDVTKFGLIFASAQKNLGIAGITLVIIRDDLLDQALDSVPEIFNYKLQTEQHSLVNTIPTFPLYMMDLMVDWINNEQGGLKALSELNAQKARLLYECIDNSHGFYINHVETPYRSQINIPFSLANESLLPLFLSEAEQEGLKYLNGHR